ncbi:hypothetical protein LMG3412_06511 [Achromobacter deleyi]|nr:hypothetical protein LMG3412_06511 [Achromobacter deleyi]
MLRLHVDVALGRDQVQPRVRPALLQARHDAQALAGVQAQRAHHRQVLVLAGRPVHGLAGRHLQVLGGDLRQPGARGHQHDGIGGVRHFALRGLRVLGRGIAAGAIQAVARDRARDRAVHGRQRRLVAIEHAGLWALGAQRRGQPQALVGAHHAVQRTRHLLGLAGQRLHARRIAHGAGVAAGGAVGGEQHARAAAHGPVGVGAQFGAHAAQAAAVVAGLVDEVAQVQFRGVLAALDLHAQLAVGVVEHDLVVARAAEFLALEAGQRGRVAVVVFACGRAVPGRCVARGQVGLGAGRVVARRGVDLRIGRAACAPARCGGRAAFAAAVVQRAHDDGLVDVVVQKAHQHLLPDARHEADAHAGAGLALRHAHPAAAGLAVLAARLPMEFDAHVAALVAQDLVALPGLRAAFGIGDHGGVHAVDRGRAAQAGAARGRQGGTPGAVAAHGFEAVGVADFAGLGEDGGVGGD